MKVNMIQPLIQDIDINKGEKADSGFRESHENRGIPRILGTFIITNDIPEIRI